MSQVAVKETALTRDLSRFRIYIISFDIADLEIAIGGSTWKFISNNNKGIWL
jgi:hypothetical protein